MPSVADAIMNQSDLREMVLDRIIDTLNSECFRICQFTNPLSPFRKIHASKCSSFQWKVFHEDLSQKAPTLSKIFSSIVTSNDKRKKTAVMSAHNPGICMALAILLKERNREMCGLQSIISLLLYSSHVDKQVSMLDLSKVTL